MMTTPVDATQPSQRSRPHLRLPKYTGGGDLGLEIDECARLVLGHAELARGTVLYLDILDLLAERNIPGVSVTTEAVPVTIKRQTETGIFAEQRPHFLLNRALTGDAAATVALSIAPYGAQDVETAWHAFARFPSREFWTRSAKVVGGLLLLTVGFIVFLLGVGGLIVSGAGICLIIPALAMLSTGGGMVLSGLFASQPAPSLTDFQRRDCLAFAQVVDWCIVRALANRGVDKNDIRVTRKPTMGGEAGGVS